CWRPGYKVECLGALCLFLVWNPAQATAIPNDLVCDFGWHIRNHSSSETMWTLTSIVRLGWGQEAKFRVQLASAKQHHITDSLFFYQMRRVEIIIGYGNHLPLSIYTKEA